MNISPTRFHQKHIAPPATVNRGAQHCVSPVRFASQEEAPSQGEQPKPSFWDNLLNLIQGFFNQIGVLLSAITEGLKELFSGVQQIKTFVETVISDNPFNLFKPENIQNLKPAARSIFDFEGKVDLSKSRLYPDMPEQDKQYLLNLYQKQYTDEELDQATQKGLDIMVKARDFVEQHQGMQNCGEKEMIPGTELNAQELAGFLRMMLRHPSPHNPSDIQLREQDGVTLDDPKLGHHLLFARNAKVTDPSKVQHYLNQPQVKNHLISLGTNVNVQNPEMDPQIIQGMASMGIINDIIDPAKVKSFLMSHSVNPSDPKAVRQYLLKQREAAKENELNPVVREFLVYLVEGKLPTPPVQAENKATSPGDATPATPMVTDKGNAPETPAVTESPAVSGKGKVSSKAKKTKAATKVSKPEAKGDKTVSQGDIKKKIELPDYVRPFDYYPEEPGVYESVTVLTAPQSREKAFQSQITANMRYLLELEGRKVTKEMPYYQRYTSESLDSASKQAVQIVLGFQDFLNHSLAQQVDIYSPEFQAQEIPKALGFTVKEMLPFCDSFFNHSAMSPGYYPKMQEFTNEGFGNTLDAFLRQQEGRESTMQITDPLTQEAIEVRLNELAATIPTNPNLRTFLNTVTDRLMQTGNIATPVTNSRPQA